jgi:hypothetical protein
MARQSSDSVTVLSAQLEESICVVRLAESENGSVVFKLEFEDANGIRVLKGADALTRWLMSRGQLWALQRIRDLAELVVAGQEVALPRHLKNSS